MRLVGAALALAAAAGLHPVATEPVITLGPGETLLSVEATGSFRTRPDTMMISAGTVTVGARAPEAVAANAVLAQRVIEVVPGAGIQARDVRTSQPVPIEPGEVETRAVVYVDFALAPQ